MEPLDLDVGSLAYFAGMAAQDAVLAELLPKFPGLRVGHGFVVQHLLGGAKTASELSVLMEISQQAVSKTLNEMERLGTIDFVRDPEDKRVKRGALSAKALASVDAARKARAKQDAALRKRVGDKRVDDVKRVLAVLLEMNGGAAQVRARRVRSLR